jgi:hypothetical protein
MANNLGSLIVSLGLDAAEYLRGLTKAEYESKKTADKLTKQFQQAAAAIASIGVGTLFVSSIRATADYAKEIDNLSKIAGVGAEELQAYGYAATSLGISTEKLADIFKDVQDKVGDFLQTGGGPLADFFENIAPKVGVTAEQFRNLSGKDALQLYVSSLEKANVSQNEMVFFMEAIASDATALIPLLTKNGEGFAKMADEAERLGFVMDKEAIAKAKELSVNLDRLGLASSSIARELGGPLVESLANTSTYFLKVAADVGFAQAALITFGAAIARTLGVDEIGELEKQAKANANAIALTVKQIETFQNLADRGVAGASDRVKDLRDQYSRLQADAAKTSAALKGAANDASGSTAIAPTLGPRLASTQNAKDIAAAEKAAKDRARILQKERDEELRAEKKLQEELLQLKREASIQGGLAVEAENEAIQKAREEYDRWIETVKASTLEGKAAAQTAEINKLFEAVEAGRLSWDEFEQASAKALGLTGEALKEVKEEVEKGKNFADELGLSFSSAFEDAIVGGKGFSEVLKGLEQDILRIIVRRAVTEPLANAIGNGFSNIFSGGKAIGGDVMGGRSYMVGERGPELFTPMGNGSITPNSGGATINQTISIDARGADAGVEQRIMQAMRQTKAETLAEVQAKANRGGSFARAVGRA